MKILCKSSKTKEISFEIRCIFRLYRREAAIFFYTLDFSPKKSWYNAPPNIKPPSLRSLKYKTEGLCIWVAIVECAIWNTLQSRLPSHGRASWNDEYDKYDEYEYEYEYEQAGGWGSHHLKWMDSRFNLNTDCLWLAKKCDLNIDWMDGWFVWNWITKKTREPGMTIIIPLKVIKLNE